MVGTGGPGASEERLRGEDSSFECVPDWRERRNGGSALGMSAAYYVRVVASSFLLVTAIFVVVFNQSQGPGNSLDLLQKLAVKPGAVERTLQYDKQRLQRLQEEDGSEGEEDGSEVARAQSELSRQETAHMQQRHKALAAAIASSAGLRGTESGAEEAQKKRAAIKWLRWKASQEEYEQAAFKDISDSEANRTDISPEGQARFDEIESHAASLDGVPGYEALLNRSYAGDANRTKAFQLGVSERAKNYTSLFPLLNKWQAQQWIKAAQDEGGGEGQESEEEGGAEHYNGAFKAKRGGSMLHAPPKAAPVLPPKKQHVGEQVEAAGTFLFAEGGMLPLHRGDHATILSVDAKDGVDKILSESGKTGYFPASDLEAETQALPSSSSSSSSAASSSAVSSSSSSSSHKEAASQHAAAARPAEEDGEHGAVAKGIVEHEERYAQVLKREEEESARKREVKKREVKKREVKKREVKKREVKKREVKKREVKKREVKKREAAKTAVAAETKHVKEGESAQEGVEEEDKSGGSVRVKAAVGVKGGAVGGGEGTGVQGEKGHVAATHAERPVSGPAAPAHRVPAGKTGVQRDTAAPAHAAVSKAGGKKESTGGGGASRGMSADLVSSGISAAEREFAAAEAAEQAKSRAHVQRQQQQQQQQAGHGHGQWERGDGRDTVVQALQHAEQSFNNAQRNEEAKSAEKRKANVLKRQSRQHTLAKKEAAREERVAVQSSVDDEKHKEVAAERERSLENIEKALAQEEEGYDATKRHEEALVRAERTAEPQQPKAAAASSSGDASRAEEADDVAAEERALASVAKEERDEGRFAEKQLREEEAAVKEAGALYAAHMLPLESR